MAGPFTEDEMIAKHGKFVNVVPSFGLTQGVDQRGRPKHRRIDDHTAGHVNLAAWRRQKIVMAMSDSVVVMVRAVHTRTGGTVHLATEDMQSAYRQIPLPDGQISISVTGVFNPWKESTELFEIYGQPFGAGHAVPNFYRVAEFLSRLIGRGYQMVVDHFFDDFFVADHPNSATVSMFCYREAFQLLGFSLDADKSQIPSEVAEILGVVFNTRSLATQRQLLVEPKTTRRLNFKSMIDRILELDELTPAVAASLLGKYQFLCSTLFGKAGRFCIQLTSGSLNTPRTRKFLLLRKYASVYC